MTSPSDRRLEPRFPANTRGIVVVPGGFDIACLIVDRSASGLKVRLDRALSLPSVVQVVDIAQGVVIEVDVQWAKGQEAGLKVRGQSALRGLIPARLTQARDAWLRAAGR